MKPFDRSLLEIFSSEQTEHIGRIRSLLPLAAAAGEIDAATMDELLRRAHTLKGASHAIGLEANVPIVHALETLFLKVRRGEAVFSQDARSLVERTLEAAEDILAAIASEKTLPDLRSLQAALEAFPKIIATPEPVSGVAKDPAPEPIGPVDSGLMRVNATRIDDLVRSSSQMLVRAVLDQEAENPFEQHALHLEQMESEWNQLRRNKHGDAGDPAAELQKARAALNYMDQRLASLRRRADRAAATWSKKTGEIRQRAEDLYENACNIRMTPAETVFSGLGPLVRELAHGENKPVEFRAEGMETQADRLVLQALKDPVLHLLRNAVSHGAQSAQERATMGKEAVNVVSIRIRPRGDRLNLTVQDDGRGIDEKAIVEEAVRRGLLPETREGTSLNIARLVLQPGFSTTRETTNISGRGMGLSIVQEAATRLHGDISIRPVKGGGTAITISVPLAMSTQHTLLVRAGGHTFGISTAYVEQLLRIESEEVRNVEGRNSIVVEGSAIPLVRLSALLRLPAGDADREEEKFFVAIIFANDERFALVADALHDERDAIIKDTGLPASHAGDTAGAIPMDDGSVAAVLNVPALMLRAGRGDAAAGFEPKVPESKTASVLVVDDSLTTRSLEKSILESHGYRVRVAVDGLQALEQIQAEKPDLVISDVMMPRMTGFELLAKIKSDSVMKNIPVILVTSLESREEQARGLELGADAYIVKHRFDQRELMQIVRQIL